MHDINDYTLGTRVRVVNRADLNFDDYVDGDTAVITEAKQLFPGFISLRVTWDEKRFANSRKEAQRCNTLYAEEVEVVKPD